MSTKAQLDKLEDKLHGSATEAVAAGAELLTTARRLLRERDEAYQKNNAFPCFFCGKPTSNRVTIAECDKHWWHHHGLKEEVHRLRKGIKDICTINDSQVNMLWDKIRARLRKLLADKP